VEENQVNVPYQVRLDIFEGPLDLLLHLIKKNEINIYDIPIALIAQQYLEYLGLMTSLNLAVAGDFLVMAATLVQIKSRMLLPDETDTDEDDGPDPRGDLVRRLLEYKQYKEAACRLDERERLWREVFYREQAAPVTVHPHESLVEDVTLFDLVDSLHAILARTPHYKRLIEIAAENLTVRDRMNVVLKMLDGKESVTFASLFENQGHRLLIIVTFLALLELTRLKLVRVFQGLAFGPILVTRALTPVSEQALDAAAKESGWEGI
jgi:segregation and condensation protein A